MDKLLVIMSVLVMFLAFQSLEALDYGDALDKAILFFEGQRSGKLPVDQRVTWRNDSALSDSALPNNVNLIGGYYSEGDNIKHVWPMLFATTLLSWAAIEYQNEISSVKQLDYLRSTIKWGTDFIILAHPSPNMLYTQVGNATADHKCWERPEDMDIPRTLLSISPASPGSEVAGEAAAALASAAIVFKPVDSYYSDKLLSHAIDLFEFADTHNGSYNASSPYYFSTSGYKDELLWAATWLYKATENNKYLSYVTSNKDWSYAVTEFSWDNKFAGVQALLASEFHNGKNDLAKFNDDVESFVCALMMARSSSQKIKLTPDGLLFTRDDSNLQYVTAAATVLFHYSKTLNKAQLGSIPCGSTQFTVPQIQNFAKYQVDYILGNNQMQMSYMVGFGTKYPTQLHHRASSLPSISSKPEKINCNEGFSYFHSNESNLNVHIGAIVGGPDSNDYFNNNRSDFFHTEPTMYINAAFIGPVAALIDYSEQTLV